MVASSHLNEHNHLVVTMVIGLAEPVQAAMPGPTKHDTVTEVK